MKIMKTSLILFMLFFATISAAQGRSEEHTSELQSQSNLVCRLLLEKKKKHRHSHPPVVLLHEYPPELQATHRALDLIIRFSYNTEHQLSPPRPITVDGASTLLYTSC